MTWEPVKVGAGGVRPPSRHWHTAWARVLDEGMDSSLVVIAWGLAAIALNVGIGRWCRAHPRANADRAAEQEVIR